VRFASSVSGKQRCVLTVQLVSWRCGHNCTTANEPSRSTVRLQAVWNVFFSNHLSSLQGGINDHHVTSHHIKRMVVLLSETSWRA
jgi:hypothetical protein